jgi:hypothetical protein
MCCKTIFTTEMSNIDSRMDTSVQYRFKTPFNQVRILPARHPASSFATHSGAQRTANVKAEHFRFDPNQTFQKHRIRGLLSNRPGIGPAVAMTQVDENPCSLPRQY